MSPARSQNESASSDQAATKQNQSAEELLKADHRKVESLFEKYASTERSAQAEVLREICHELTVHTRLEEEIFYPSCREKGVEHLDLDEAQVEHDTVNMLIAELQSDASTDSFHDAKVKVLQDYVKLHVGEEEDPKNGIFAKASAAGLDMTAVGQKLQTRKTELQRESRPESDPPTFRSLHIRFGSRSQESRSMARYQQMPERDEYGRFTESHRGGGRYRDDDDYDDDRRGSNARYQERDEYGRFVSDDDNGHRSSRGSYQSQGRGRYEDDDNNGRQHDHGGWYGDSRGHSEASRRGWETRHMQGEGGYGQSRSGRSYYDEPGYRGARSRDDDHEHDRGQGGWFGDPRGHSEASRRGWEHRDDHRQYSSRRDYDDDRGNGRSSRYR
jgi:Hemerythrin HHE cation binding domain